MRSATSDPGFLELGDDELREAALSNWVQLNKVLRQASHLLTHRLFELEAGALSPRLQILNRLYGKLAKSRAKSEKRIIAALVASGGEVGDGDDLQQLLRALEPTL